MKKTFILALLSTSLLGCGNLVKHFVDTPEIKWIELKTFSPDDNKAYFEVALHNPNSFLLPVSGMNGSIVLNQLVIGNIEAETEQSIPANTTQSVTIPISLNPDILIKAAKSVLSHKKAQYSLKGDLDTSVGQIPFNKTGKLSMKDIIAILLK